MENYMSTLDEIIMRETLAKIEEADPEIYDLLSDDSVFFTARGRINIAAVARHLDISCTDVKTRFQNIAVKLNPDHPVSTLKYGRKVKPKDGIVLCFRCRTAQCDPGKRCCINCSQSTIELAREIRNQRNREYRKKLHDAGLCSLCTKNPSREGLQMCESCATKRREIGTAMYKLIGRG